jgi:hypothetical protein
VTSADVARLATAVDEITRRIGADPDPHRAYLDATQLSLVARDLLDAAARERGTALARMITDGDLSLSTLAATLGLSKSRVAQLITTSHRGDALGKEWV